MSNQNNNLNTDQSTKDAKPKIDKALFESINEKKENQLKTGQTVKK